MQLSVLDQSPIISGHTPREAIEQTLNLARAAEKLGYSRYWLAEHHAIGALARRDLGEEAAQLAPEIQIRADDRERLGVEVRHVHGVLHHPVDEE